MTEFEFQLENFMLYCTSRNLARKTLSSYEQTLKLFGIYIDEQFNITDATSGHIRQYIKYLQERGKYTVIARAETKEVNFPHNRADYKRISRKQQSLTMFVTLKCSLIGCMK